MRLERIVFIATLAIIIVAAFSFLLAAAADDDDRLMRQQQHQQQQHQGDELARPSRKRRMRQPHLRDFNHFKRLYRKIYARQTENMRRAKLYLRRALHVFKENILYLKRKSSKYLKINTTSDWTDKERESIFSALVPSSWSRNRHWTNQTMPAVVQRSVRSSHGRSTRHRAKVGLTRTLRRIKRRRKHHHTSEAVPAAFREATRTRPPAPVVVEGNQVLLDYRDTGCLPAPKSQLKCGACYIFSATTLFEYHHCQQSGKLVPFSEQYAIDCDRRTNLRGCDGGIEDWVGDYFAQYGLETMRKYPFVAQDQECPFGDNPRASGRIKASGAKITLVDYAQLTPEQVQSWLEQKGPMTMAVYDLHDFADYGGGVDVVESCSETGGHAMVLIGHGREDGLDYWLLRNSHGTEWGIEGHYKMAKSSNPKCIIRVGFMQTVPKFRASRQAAAKAALLLKKLHE